MSLARVLKLYVMRKISEEITLSSKIVFYQLTSYDGESVTVFTRAYLLPIRRHWLRLGSNPVVSVSGVPDHALTLCVAMS